MTHFPAQVIEEYRARIRKLSRATAKGATAGTQPASAGVPPAAAAAASAAAKHKEELDALCAQFRAFLAQSHRFYFNLISRLCAAHGLKTDGSVDLHPLLGACTNGLTLMGLYALRDPTPRLFACARVRVCASSCLCLWCV